MEETTRPIDVKSCLDCGTPVDRRFCPQCGLKAGPRQRPFWSMLIEFLAESFALDGRFWRSLLPLLFKPGTLTREYNAGRRARYVSPFKLYLMSAFVLFFSFTVKGWIEACAIVPEPTSIATSTEARSPSTADADRIEPDAALAQSDAPKTRISGIEELPRNRPIFRRLHDRLDAANRDRAEWKGILADWIGTVPTTLFVLLPIFGFLAWIALVGTKTYFAEAFVFLLHVYSFTYLFLLVHGVTPEFPGKFLTFLILPAYFIVALARGFGLTWYSAVLRSTALAIVFAPILLAAGFLALAYAAGMA